MIQDTLTIQLTSIRRESADVKSFRLVRPNGAILPSFTAGSHIDVHVACGLIRQYSLCNGPTDRRFYEIAVKRETSSRGGSEAMCDRAKEGDLLRIGLPRNNFPLADDADFHLLVAAGIGVTPLLSMARHLATARRPFRFHYFVRSNDHAPLLDRLAGANFRGLVQVHRAIEPGELRKYVRGILDRVSEGAHMYLCGPRPFMDAVKDVAAGSWPAESMHIEHFSADPVTMTGAKTSFEVTLARTGGTYVVPENKTIVEVLLENGVVVNVSCEQGVCGTCLTGVLEGVPDHRDVYLTEEERASGNLITPCVSRAASKRLVLDL